MHKYIKVYTLDTFFFLWYIFIRASLTCFTTWKMHRPPKGDTLEEDESIQTKMLGQPKVQLFLCNIHLMYYSFCLKYFLVIVWLLVQLKHLSRIICCAIPKSYLLSATHCCTTHKEGWGAEISQQRYLSDHFLNTGIFAVNMTSNVQQGSPDTELVYLFFLINIHSSGGIIPYFFFFLPLF